MRYFIALDFKQPERERFHSLAKTLKTYAEKARIVEEDHVHLTLAFLGEIDEDAIESAKAVLNRIEEAPFTLEFDTVSYFDAGKRGRIFWIGPDAHPTLDTLHTRVTEALREKGFTLDERPFTPHVTLARGVRISKAQSSDFEDAFEAFQTPVQSVSLMASTFKEGKLVYTPIATRALKPHSS